MRRRPMPLRRTPMKPTSDLKHLQHGDHLCLLYRSVEEQKNVVSPFIEEGLSRGELCLYIADEHMDPELADLLASDGIDLLRLRQEGSVQLSTRYQTFLRYARSEEHTSELQSRENLVCRLLL